MTEQGEADVEASVNIAAAPEAVYRIDHRPADDGGAGRGDNVDESGSGATARSPGRCSRAPTATAARSGRPRAPSPMPNRGGCSRSTCAARSCPWRIGATTSSRPTAAAPSPSGPGTVGPAGSACRRVGDRREGPQGRQRRAHRPHAGAAEGEGRSARSPSRAGPAILSATTAIGDVVVPARPSCRSASLYARYMPRTPSQRSGSGSQLRDRWPDPGQLGQRGPPVEHQVGQGAAGEVGGGDAVADVAARPAQTRGPVQHDAGLPVPRHREHAAPAVGDRARRGPAAARRAASRSGAGWCGRGTRPSTSVRDA